MARRLLALLTVVLALAQPTRAQGEADQVGPPRFVTSSLDAISCKVVRNSAAIGGGSLVQVEVDNAGELTVEPATIHVLTETGAAPPLPETKIWSTDRIPSPATHCRGRGVPPGESRRYWVQIRADRKALSNATARVASAIFYIGSTLEQPPIRIGEPTQREASIGAGSAETTVVPVENLTENVVNLVCRARYTAPRRGEGLVTLQLRPGELTDWTIATVPEHLSWDTQDPPIPVKITKLEPLDWTLRVTDADTLVEDAVELAMRRLAPLHDARPRFSGRFVARLRLVKKEDTELHEIRGSFEAVGTSSPRISVEGVPDRKDQDSVVYALRRAFEFLRRPKTKTALRYAEITPISGRGGTREVKWEGHGWSDKPSEFVHIDSNRFVAFGSRNKNGLRWTLRRSPHGDLLHAREEFVRGKLEAIDSISYGVRGATVFPVTSYSVVDNFLGHRALALRLEDVRTPDRKQKADRPGGRDAEIVRIAWDSAYSYPLHPATFSARFDLRTDPEARRWLGRDRIKGKVNLVGFRGFRSDGSGWSDASITIDDRDLTEMEQARLAHSVETLLHDWALVDPAGRAPFDDEFAGATVQASSLRSGTFSVSNGAFAEVEIEQGRIVSLSNPHGTPRRIRWNENPKRPVAVLIRSGTERVEVRDWHEKGDWIVPSTIEFEARGSGEAGESLELRQIRIK